MVALSLKEWKTVTSLQHRTHAAASSSSSSEAHEVLLASTSPLRTLYRTPVLVFEILSLTAWIATIIYWVSSALRCALLPLSQCTERL